MSDGGDLKTLIAQLLADCRHNRLEVTYGRKKCSVMAVDEMTADQVILLIAQQHELMLAEYERAGMLWRNPAPCAAPPAVPTGAHGRIGLASVDTRPKGQDAQQGLAGTESGAVPKADAHD